MKEHSITLERQVLWLFDGYTKKYPNPSDGRRSMSTITQLNVRQRDTLGSSVSSLTEPFAIQAWADKMHTQFLYARLMLGGT